MTNYNDGNWHKWDGGDCPVHPESMVITCHLAWGYPHTTKRAARAGAIGWGNVIAFQVTKEHKELREYWIKGTTALSSKACIPPWEDSKGWVHVREVE